MALPLAPSESGLLKWLRDEQRADGPKGQLVLTTQLPALVAGRVS